MPFFVWSRNVTLDDVASLELSVGPMAPAPGTHAIPATREAEAHQVNCAGLLASRAELTALAARVDIGERQMVIGEVTSLHVALSELRYASPIILKRAGWASLRREWSERRAQLVADTHDLLTRVGVDQGTFSTADAGRAARLILGPNADPDRVSALAAVALGPVVVIAVHASPFSERGLVEGLLANADASGAIASVSTHGLVGGHTMAVVNPLVAQLFRHLFGGGACVLGPAGPDDDSTLMQLAAILWSSSFPSPRKALAAARITL